MSSGLRRTIIAIVIVVIIVIGIIGYAVVGLAYATTRVAGANRALNTVVSHQNNFNSTFKDINAGFNGLSTSSFDPKQARALYDKVVVNATAARTTVDSDDASLATTKESLNEQQWLTVLSKGSLDTEAQKIDHARKALTFARTLAADQVLDAQFFQVLMDVMVDLDTLGTQTATADLVAAKTTLATMKTHVDKALQLSTAPGLPIDLHNVMVDFQTFVADFGKLIDASAAGDTNAIISSDQAVGNDATKIGNYNYGQMAVDIDTYYKPLLDAYDAEMQKATA